MRDVGDGAGVDVRLGVDRVEDVHGNRAADSGAGLGEAAGDRQVEEPDRCLRVDRDVVRRVERRTRLDVSVRVHQQHLDGDGGRHADVVLARGGGDGPDDELVFLRGGGDRLRCCRRCCSRSRRSGRPPCS